MNNQKKKVCRLCYYETVDTTDIFSEKGTSFDYIGKIRKYLYFSVSTDDELPKTVCWMCTQHLETFHRFCKKINDIQKVQLSTEKYENLVLQPQYNTNQSIEQSISLEQRDTVDDDDDENTFEILVISEDFEPKSTIDNEIEEFELLEVDHVDGNAENAESKDTTDEQCKDDKAQLMDLDEAEADNEVPTTVKIFHTRSRYKQKPNAKIDVGHLRKSARQMAKTQKTVQSHQPLKTSRTIIISGKKEKQEKCYSRASQDASEIELMQQDYDDVAEGESDDEFPARDSDNEDWPSQETLNGFPKTIIKDGLLLVKGKELMSMICRFYNLECKKCVKKSKFKQLNELLDHYANAHNESGYVECCQTKLSRYPAIIMHMARHLQPDAFKCKICGYVVTRPRFLESHQQTHLPDDQKPYACNECPRRFCWKSALRIHMISHQPEEERRRYICHVCGRSYDTPGGLSTHKKLAHGGIKQAKSNVCHICAKNFSTRTGLHEHMVTIHQPREKGQMQCTECGKWLMNNRCLKTHMILHSNAEFRCDQCDYVTKKKVLLNRHLLTQHSNDRPHVCNLCGRDFKMKRALTVHIAQHGTTTKYKCPFCERTFNSSTNFYTHRKSSHPKQLEEMKRLEEEERRRKRIEAGVEEEPSYQVNEIHDTQLILTTDSGEQYTVLEII